MNDTPLDTDTANRRLRLIELISGYDKRADFVRKYDLNDSFLHQLVTGKAPFGEKAARNMEEKLGLPFKYFDERPGLSPQPYSGRGVPTNAMKVAELATILGASGKLTEEKAKLVIDLLEALTEESPANGGDAPGKRAA